MGVDACLLAKLKKQRCYFDREDNLRRWWDLESDPHRDEASELYDRARPGNPTFKGGLTKTEMQRLLILNYQGSLKTEHGQERIGWTEKMIRFVNHSPEDERFKVVTDHDQDGYKIWDRYEEFEP